MQVLYYPELDSTNRLAREMAGTAVPGMVIRAGRQSAGRGQYERGFASPEGGLYFSLLLRPPVPAREVSIVTLAAGLGCRDALRELCGLEAMIKWPNDLYAADRKIAGILSEYVASPGGTEGMVVVGVGVNLNSRVADFPPELHDILGTVRDLTGREHDMDAALAACVAGIEARAGQLADDRARFLADWREADYLCGRPLRHLLKETELARGAGLGINEAGRYLLRLEHGETREILGGRLRILA